MTEKCRNKRGPAPLAPPSPWGTSLIPWEAERFAALEAEANVSYSRSTCMIVSLSSPSRVLSKSSSLSVRHPVQGVSLGSFGRGHALQRIDLYPVRAQALSSHN